MWRQSSVASSRFWEKMEGKLLWTVIFAFSYHMSGWYFIDHTTVGRNCLMGTHKSLGNIKDRTAKIQVGREGGRDGLVGISSLFILNFPNVTLGNPFENKRRPFYRIWILFPQFSLLFKLTIINSFNRKISWVNSPYYLPYSSLVTLENLVLYQLIIPLLIFILYSLHLSAGYCIIWWYQLET